jgi:phosphatidylethanolamine/phosphatidyl-N-methylethanolamine N-methyltransferase
MEIDRGAIERVYDRYSGFYDRTFGRVFRHAREDFMRSLPVRRGDRVLEVGVGTGLCLPLYPSRCDVTGIDVSSGMLRKAADRVDRLELSHVRLVGMDAGDMSFPDSSFDLVVAAYVVTAVPDHRRLMGEMIRVSRPGGRIVLLNHFTHDSRVVSLVERAISPVCSRIGFRTDLSVQEVVAGWPVSREREERVSLFGLWQVVECVNDKSA